MDPCAASKVYWSVCIPSMLYGAEVLELSHDQQRKVETAHRQMAKQVQGLPECTPDPATLAQKGWVSTECFINRKCMLLAWKLLNLQD